MFTPVTRPYISYPLLFKKINTGAVLYTLQKQEEKYVIWRINFPFYVTDFLVPF
jgi:hypothetical protein